MSASKNEILDLITDLAVAASEWEGGASGGVAYTGYQWRAKLLAIAERAKKLRDPRSS